MEVDDWAPLSALQHLVFCERQAALIHVERLWADDRATAEGQVFHERVHGGGASSQPGLRIERDVSLHSESLGVRGRADLVEYHADVSVPGGFRPYPVEYKSGRPKKHGADEVQLCAQAICLEEAHALTVPQGSLYYGAVRRRVKVDFDEGLRGKTRSAAARMREIVERGEVPAARLAPKCQRCSLRDLCLPQVTQAPGSSRQYLDSLLSEGE